MDLRTGARVAARRTVARVLGLVPFAWLSWLRDLHARSRHGSSRRRALGAVLEVVRHRDLRGVGSFSLVDRPEVRMLAADSLVVRRLYWFGELGYETSEAAWWRWFCERSSRILELGANVGSYTV